MRRSSRRLLALLGLLAVGVLVVAFAPVRQYLQAFEAWVDQGHNRTWGLVVVALAYTPAAVIFFPASVLTLGAGALFGVGESIIAISLGSTFGAAVAFVLGRTLARRWVEEKFGHSRRFRALDQAVAEQGFRIVLLTRLSPVFPYTVMNYAYSLSRVSFRDYILGSWLGMLPGTVLYVSLGAGAKGFATLLADLLSGRGVQDPRQLLFLTVGVLATVAATVVITRTARRALRRAQVDDPSALAEPEQTTGASDG
jgi:uncharacterized membrane protein YdjX (TVP38/TMEM64 family)